MMKFKVSILSSIFLFFPTIVGAQVYISEIMYDPPGTDTGREWLEIHNSGSQLVNVSSWKFFEEGANHGLSSFQGGMDLSPNTYAVIVSDPTKFSEDFPSFSGIIIDSSWSSFNNSGETLALKDASGAIIDSVTYVGGGAGAGDGKSLQKINNSWQGATPTPGLENKASSVEPSETISTESEIAENPTQVKELKISVTTDLRAVSGVPFKFYVKVTDEKGMNSLVGKFVWNFGDGTKREIVDGVEVTHTYKHPGKYIVYLAYNQKPYIENFLPDKIVKLTVNVSEAGLSIASIKNNGVLEIKNETDSEHDISGWAIVNGGQIYIFPDRSAIFAKSSIFLDEEIHQISNLNANSKVGLYLPSGKLYNFYPNLSEKTSVSTVSSTNSTAKNDTTNFNASIIEENGDKEELLVDVETKEDEGLSQAENRENLSSKIENKSPSVVLANVYESESNINPKIFIGAFILFCLIMLFAFSRFSKKSVNKKESDEYEILS